jgi:ribonuclease HI
MIVEVWFDGGARTNPTGEAASAAIVRDLDGRTLRHIGLAIGIASNNEAEWTALHLGLEAARDLGATGVRAFGDSKLVVEQFSGTYAIHAENLRAIALAVSAVACTFTDGVTATWVPRSENKPCDRICNLVLDGAYVADADLDAAPGDAPNTARENAAVTVSFVVDVTMDPAEARAAASAGISDKALRKRLAERAERALLLCGRVGGDAFRPLRVKG